ncbi:metal ABC transporter permease [Thermocoleostomius sinensis]|uniref:Metal ABC transporter permease n=1 Tax=Thermocoleostomius sinensis A174 TaxID=2016057 RepID=A0A9E9C6I8_9CYAN|nr:metal ABC transporter permease [Thermocoleostomius sinensis]WAL58233.1 metal ABC transporter permease [Thermocoleostomius sinensis A174]
MLDTLDRITELMSFPFMQRALLGGILTGILGGLLGSFAILRQLSFFSHTVGHAALLGIVLAVLFNLNPTLALLPFTVLFGLGVIYLISQTNLWSDAVLNIVFSVSLAGAILALSFVEGYRGNLMNLLFGDILAIQSIDLWLTTMVCLVSAVSLLLTHRAQVLLTLHEGMAKAQGVAVQQHQAWFIVLLSLAVAVAIKAVGVLLVNAFLVIPAATAKLISHQFAWYVLLAIGIGALSAILGIVMSAAWNLASGPSIVVAQFGLFAIAILVSRLRQTS